MARAPGGGRAAGVVRLHFVGAVVEVFRESHAAAVHVGGAPCGAEPTTMALHGDSWGREPKDLGNTMLLSPFRPKRLLSSSLNPWWWWWVGVCGEGGGEGERERRGGMGGWLGWGGVGWGEVVVVVVRTV